MLKPNLLQTVYPHINVINPNTVLIDQPWKNQNLHFYRINMFTIWRSRNRPPQFGENVFCLKIQTVSDPILYFYSQIDFDPYRELGSRL